MLKKICCNCRKEYQTTGHNQKYCKECIPIMRKALHKKCNENEKYRPRKKKYVPKGNSSFEDLTKRAKEMGITYGKLQAMIYMGQV